jgi:hypothetical protein
MNTQTISTEERQRIKAKERYQKNRTLCLEQERERRKSNPEAYKKRRQAYYKKNREKLLERSRGWHQNNKDKVSIQKKEWRKNNPGYMNDYNKKRCNKDPLFRLARNLRSRISMALREGGHVKGTNSEDLLGCTVQEAKAHLESLFEPGMSWNNNTKNGWHIDHIVPCAAFNLEDLEEQKKCFHYTNLKPLWAVDNESKGSLHGGIRHRYN